MDAPEPTTAMDTPDMLTARDIDPYPEPPPMTTRPLYAITAELIALNERLDDGALDPEIDAYLAGLEAEQAVKLDGYLALLGQLRMEAVAARAERDQWAAKEQARTDRIARLEARLKAHLEATGQPKVTTATGRVVSIVRNGGTLPVEYKPLIRPSDLPAEYQRVEINKPAVREALERGEQLDFAELLPRGTHLRIG